MSARGHGLILLWVRLSWEPQLRDPWLLRVSWLSSPHAEGESNAMVLRWGLRWGGGLTGSGETRGWNPLTHIRLWLAGHLPLIVSKIAKSGQRWVADPKTWESDPHILRVAPVVPFPVTAGNTLPERSHLLIPGGGGEWKGMEISSAKKEMSRDNNQTRKRSRSSRQSDKLETTQHMFPFKRVP